MHNDLTSNNAVSHVSSLTPDGAAHFTAASSQSLTIPTNASMELPSGPLTLGGWVKLDSFGVNRVIMAKDDDATTAGSDYWLGYEQSTGKFGFQVEIVGGTEVSVRSDHFLPTTGVWYFVVGWFDPGVGASIQVNNGAIDFMAGTDTNTNVSATAFSIGSDAGVGSFMDGTIDSAFMFKRVLSNAERTLLFNAVANTVNPNFGTLTGGVTYSADVPSALSANVNSLSFNGSSGYVAAHVAVPCGGAGLGSTISLWFKPAAFGGMVLGQSNSANAYVRILNSTTIRVQTVTIGTFKDFTVPAMSLGTWYQLRIDYNANLRVFINNVESSSGAQTEVPDGLFVDQVGRYWDGLSGLFWNGKVADARLYSRAVVSSADAAALAAGQTTSEPPTVWWKFNEGSGTNAVDFVPTGQPLTYAQLSTALRDESFDTFISYWDLGESSGTRFDLRVIAAPPGNDPTPAIVTILADAQALSARTHRLSGHAENSIELWYLRDKVWSLFPVQPLSGPTSGLELTQTYKQPSTLAFTLPDQNGYYVAEDMNSPYNYNDEGVYDPLLDEARKICLRVGAKCYRNLVHFNVPTSTLAPTFGLLNYITDGDVGNIAANISQFAVLVPTDATPIDLTWDLGSTQPIYHVVARIGSNTGAGTATFPASVQVSLSLDGSTYTHLPVRPAGGAGGDWNDSTTGQTPEFAFCDIDRNARYVRVTIVPNGPQNVAIDEIAVYGGRTFDVLGQNVFTGYLGDQLDFEAAGFVTCTTTDVLKKLADNNDVWLTAAYRLTSSGAPELADIAYSLLTSSAYWIANPTNPDAYDAPFRAQEIGWQQGSGLTGLQYPLWQGQSNNMLGYQRELFDTIGWNFFADGSGALQATDPPTTQRLPDRVCIAANDGNYDVRECKRQRTGKNMRNKVIVQTGKASSTSGSGTITQFDPNSVARFGRRTTRITDPLASTVPLRQRVADYFLRDYAWNLQTLSAVMRPQFETALKQVFAFRAGARPNLYPKTSTTPGSKHKQELWSLVGMKHTITYGKWEAQCDFIPYVPKAVDSPNFTALNSVGGHPTWMTFVYDAITDPLVVAVRVYISTQGESTGFSLYNTSSSPGVGTFTLATFTPDIQIWAYLTAVDADGNESIPSGILSAIPGNSSQSVTCYTIGDLTVASILTDGPDAQGYYTYQFLGLWTAPTCGFTQDHVRAFVGDSPPSDPDNMNSWPLHDDSWNWWAPNRILSGLTWDNQTPGQLDFVFKFRSKSNLSGVKMYWRLWNSTATRSWHPVPSNYTFCTVA